MIMTDAPQLETVLALGLQLPARDRLKLVERLVSSVENEIKPDSVNPQKHWGQELVRALESGELDTSAWVDMSEDDLTRLLTRTY
jgi:hypothetical protein